LAEFLFGAASDLKDMVVSMAACTRRYHGTERDLCRRMVVRQPQPIRRVPPFLPQVGMRQRSRKRYVKTVVGDP
jgi:hypothetical protein